MSRAFQLSVLAVGLLAAAPATQAYEAGDVMLRAGAAHVAPNDSSSDLNLEGVGTLPNAGVGVNYTHFFEEKTTTTLTTAVDGVAQDILGTAPGTINGTELELDESVGVALELGIDWMLNENFGLNAALWWADISTNATITALADGAEAGKITTEVDIDPMVYMVGVTYRF